MAQQGYFPQYTFAIDYVIKDAIHSLDGDLSACRFLDGKADAPIGTLTEKLETFVVRSDIPVCEAVETDQHTRVEEGRSATEWHKSRGLLLSCFIGVLRW